MANPDHLKLLKTEKWNEWRAENPGTTPDLTRKNRQRLH